MIQIGIIGSAGKEEYPTKTKNLLKAYRTAEELGKLVAKMGAIVITGGKGGVMESAAKGAKNVGGLTVGIVKGDVRKKANKYIDIEINSNTSGEGEEDILVSSCDGIFVIGGGAGTLQEIACAYRKNKTIVTFNNIEGIGKKFSDMYLDDRKNVKIIGFGVLKGIFVGKINGFLGNMKKIQPAKNDF